MTGDAQILTPLGQRPLLELHFKARADGWGAKMFQWRSIWGLFAIAVVVCSAKAAALAQADDVPLSVPAVSVSEYRAQIERILGEFAEDAQRHKAQLTFELHENSSGTGAFTWRKEGGRTWEFHFYDGALKMQKMSEDVLTLIVCHELGHHFAGYPFKQDSLWSAAEGQADFFATQACVPRLWKDDWERNAHAAKVVAPKWKQECDAAFVSQPRRNLCYRSLNALEAARFYEGRNEKSVPELHRSDRTVVAQTETGHSGAQCRLDTQKAGALCAREFDFSFVPGQRFPVRNSIESEIESALSVCSGADSPLSAQRPRCWFAPLMRGVK